MKKEDFIIYEYMHRDDVLSNLVTEMLDYVYSKAYPKPEKSFMDMCHDITKKRDEEGHQFDKNYRLTYCDGKYQWPIDFFYMPHEVQREIFDNRKDAYDVREYWKDDMESLIGFLYNEPGFKEVYDDEHNRTNETQPLIKDVIGEENALKLKQILEEYMHTYRWGLRDVNAISWSFLSMPCCNRDTVVNAWKEAFGVDIVIPDDKYWIDEYKYSDMEYEGEFDND